MTNLEQRKANMVYEIASLINDDPLSAPVLIEELIEVMFDEQIDHIEDVIVNHFGVEVYGEETHETVWQLRTHNLRLYTQVLS